MRKLSIIQDFFLLYFATGSNDGSNMGRGSKGNKPMQPGDYEKVEHELQKQMMRERMGQAAHMPHWQDLSELTSQALGNLFMI